jgi:hypothetical protein
MSVSLIDATVEDAQIQTDRAGVIIYRSLRLRLASGEVQQLAKVLTAKDVGTAIVAGAQGRFYLNKVLGVQGVHGVRLADGTALYGWPGSNDKIYILAGVIGALWVLVLLATRGAIPILGLGLASLGGSAWYISAKVKREAQAQFEGDAG